MTKHDLSREQQQQLVARQADALRAERFQHQINITRWEAIPEDLRDGTEEEGIENARHAIMVIEAQLNALAALAPTNRAERRASRPKR